MKRAKKNWNLYKNGELQGVFTSSEISELIGMNRNNVSNYAELGSLYKGIYRIEKADEALEIEWAAVTGGITARARR
jgi:hypothetical protein